MTDQYAEALRVLEQSVSVDSGSAWAWLELGFVQHRLRDLIGALKSAQTSVELHDASREAWLFLGRVEQGSRHFTEAIKAYRRAIVLSLEHPFAHRALASALFDRSGSGDLEEAKQEIETALTGLGEESFTQLTAGHIYSKLSQIYGEEAKAREINKGDRARGPM